MTQTAEYSTLVTLLASDLVDSTRLVERLGDARAAQVFSRHDRLARDLMAEHGAREIDKTDGFLLRFDRPTDAVLYAIAYHDRLAALGRELDVPLAARAGIHVGEVILRENAPADVARGAKPVEVEGLAKPVVARLMSLAGGRQTLLTRAPFDLARRGTIGSDLADGSLSWLAHGSYVAKGLDEPIEVYEVGRTGFAPLAPPPDSEKIRRAIDPDTIVGWRPAPGIDLPRRPHWVLEEKIASGGFGDVWRAQHRKTGEKRVYKFCYDSGKLRALKREVTLVRLLKEQLGDRKDIARIIDWNFDEVPYFIESEWTAGGSLDRWLEDHGGAAQVPLPTRIDIVAQVADALAAAHSVGVLHKDIKPSNILMTEDAEGRPRAQLTDFGIGLLTDQQVLAEAGITLAGFTELGDSDEFGRTGTRLYMAPELNEGRPATVHADVYALGVVLYQLLIGDLNRAVSPGWERDVEDPLLREDIARAVDGEPERRVDVRTLATRLRSLDQRRREYDLARAAGERAERARRRRRVLGLAGTGLALVAVATAVQLRRVADEARRANREAETSRRVSEFLLELFRLADPGETRGSSVTAREILDQGARRIETGLQDQPEVQATLMATMGSVYLGLGLAGEARPILEQSLEIRRRIFPERSAEVAEGLKLLGDVEYGTGDYEAAERQYVRAAELRAELMGPDHPLVADALQGLSRARWRRADYAGATEAGERAVAIYEAAGNQAAALAEAVSRLGVVTFTVRKFAEAESLFRRSLDLARTVYGPEDRRVAQMLNNLAMALTAEQRFEEARGYAAQGLEMYRKLLGVEHPLVATSSSALATVLHQLHRLSEAEALQRQALAIDSVRLGTDHPETGGTMTMLAWVLADQGKYDEAEMLARRAREVLQASLPPEHWAIALAESILGECLAARGRHREAEPLLTRSYEVIQRTQGGLWADAALRRVIAFYERQGNRPKAEEYRRLLPADTRSGRTRSHR